MGPVSGTYGASHFRHVNGRELIVHRSSSRSTPDAVTAAPFPTTLKTTVINQRPSWWFGASVRTAAPEGQTTSITRPAPQSTRPPFPSRLASCVRVHKPHPDEAFLRVALRLGLRSDRDLDRDRRASHGVCT